ncbi:MAG: acyloxyacyl hydrolase [Fimbriimonadaceae bacterium]
MRLCGFARTAAILMCLVGGQTIAQESRWGVRTSIYQCQPIFSSEDLREGISVAATYTVPWNRLRFRSHRAELTIEGHYDISNSDGYSGRAPDVVDGYGLMAFSRYRGRSRNGLAGYFEMGWGLYYSPKLSLDIDNHLSSTPTLGVGVVTRTGSGREVFAGIRLMHISNGGLSKGNQGQNRLQLTLAGKL